MPARLFEETLTQGDELFGQVTDQLQKRCEDRIHDLRIIIYQNGLILQGARPHVLRQADGPRGCEIGLGPDNR